MPIQPVSSVKYQWTKTNEPNLYRHANGQYYARLKIGKKDVWKSLRTSRKVQAIHRLDEILRAAQTRRASGTPVAEGAFRFRDAALQYTGLVEKMTHRSENTRRNRLAGLNILMKSWPELADMLVSKLTTQQVNHWFTQLKRDAKPHVPNGARKPAKRSTGRSATRLNGALDALRYMLDLAVDQGYVPTNAARDRRIIRVTPTRKHLVLPAGADFVRLVETIRHSGTQQCQEAADMVSFLALTGSRVNEARHVLWKHVNFSGGRVTIVKPKNGIPRDVPMTPELLTLLHRKRRELEKYPDVAERSVLGVKECQGFLTSACKKLGLARITHHDLRHLYATTAMEANVDVPSVATLLGHRDGGALAMKTYGHVRTDHLKQAAQKIRYGLIE